MPLTVATEPQAQAFYNVLEAIFDYADANIEPKGIGLWTQEKQSIMAEKSGMPEPENLKFVPISTLTNIYRIMGCPVYLLPRYVADASIYEFRDPDQPALTKAGYIKSMVINILLDNDKGTTYDTLQGCITNCDIQIKDPNERSRFCGGRYLPLPERSTVEWYARSLAPVLGAAQLEKTRTRLEASMNACIESMKALVNSQSGPNPPSRTVFEQYAEEQNRLLEEQQMLQILRMNAQLQAQMMRDSFAIQDSGNF